MDNHICQSCGMPLNDAGFYGTNSDESVNKDYCIYCFANGEFTEDITMEEMIEYHLQFIEESNVDSEQQSIKDEAVTKIKETIPNLKRWKND